MTGKLKPPDKRRRTCFGMPHAGFFKVFVVANMLQILICFAVVGYDVGITIKALETNNVHENLEQEILFYLRIVAWSWFSCHCLLSFFLDLWLFRNSAMPNTTFLRVYAIFQCTSLPLMFVLYYTLLIRGGSYLPYPPVQATMLLPAHVLYRLYTSYVVVRYSRDIQFDKELKSGYRQLTDEEVALFEMGASCDESKKYYENCHEMAQFKAYDRQVFEIKKTALDFSELTTLGCGEYGCVYKVYWEKKGTRQAVAVKTVDPQMSDVHQFKALLSEAKVMMFMGSHENVVGLLGVCTEEIRERKLFIVCELCELGNLKTHLRSERNTFVNLLPTEMIHQDDIRSAECMTTLDLVRWAAQVATGMEFLGKKKIIHGDLATRNVLLTSTKIVKITDFGLSRRLYNYNVYKKRHNVPMPWRWLALESLVDMDFSSCSDVWSYGITCWEIFELGARPWPEFQQFNSEFIDALKAGILPEKGDLCPSKIYATMCLCWSREPSGRPTFSDLKQYFIDLAHELTVVESSKRRISFVDKA